MCRCSKWILVLYISKDKNLKILFKVNNSVTIFLYKCAYILYLIYLIVIKVFKALVPSNTPG